MKIQFQMYFWELSLQVTQKIDFIKEDDILHWRNQDPRKHLRRAPLQQNSTAESR